MTGDGATVAVGNGAVVDVRGNLGMRVGIRVAVCSDSPQAMTAIAAKDRTKAARVPFISSRVAV